MDPHDIAAVAAVAFTSAGHDGRRNTLSGPDPLRPAGRVRILGEVLGRDLRFEGQPDDEARAEMSKTYRVCRGRIPHFSCAPTLPAMTPGSR
jgi:uncharacterized protein YbjT (DUF2867 family)